MNIWFELYSKPNIRENTQEYYRRFIDLHIIPHIGSIKLTKLTSRDIQKMYNDVREHGRTRKEQKDKTPGLSSSYVRGIHTMLHNCLGRAVKESFTGSPARACPLLGRRKKEGADMQLSALAGSGMERASSDVSRRTWPRI